MKTIFAAALALVLMPGLASAGTSCSSYRSGSYTKTSCTHSSAHGRTRFSHGVSYMSGHVRKSYWN
jgi:hypothetical protein